MNIFYYSVHEILEHDEVSLFRKMGHHVFSFSDAPELNGSNRLFRPAEKLSPTEQHLHSIYTSLGGKYGTSTSSNETLPSTFIKSFSAAVVMNDITFIQRFWNELRNSQTIWRTIGQGVGLFDSYVQAQRNDGLRVVRYSPKEAAFVGSIGSDAIIRFGKDPRFYAGWNGLEKQVLTFSNGFAERYPSEARDFTAITANVRTIVGGNDNESFPYSIGLISHDKQAELYRSSRVYLYASGPIIPYTLNFMEAWLTGTPMVVYAPLDRRGAFYEVDELVTHGIDGFVCRDIESAQAAIKILIEDDALALRISKAGRQRALQLFSNDLIEQQWIEFFKALALPS